MAKRLVQEGKAQTTAKCELLMSIQFLDENMPGDGSKPSEQGAPPNSADGAFIGKMFTKVQYGAALNRGEFVRCWVDDPYFTMVAPGINQKKSYFNTSRVSPPINVKTKLLWAPNKLSIPWVNHALVYIKPTGGPANAMNVELFAIDYASWYLNAGDAGGHSYKGSIHQVIPQVVNRYGNGQLTADVRTKTKDSEHNIWWQYRLDPKSFIMSLLDWSSDITDKQTHWLVYPDSEETKPKVIFVEQAAMTSLKRATYHYAGVAPGQNGKLGDIIEWEMLGNNSLGLFGQQLVTSGISSTSGIYYDKTSPDHGKTSRVGDPETPNKLKPKTTEKNAFTKPPDDYRPLDATVIPSIPEVPDLGLPYGEYITGRARRVYLALQQHLHTARIRVTGHHIWSTSEGLGCDTIEVTMDTPRGLPHFMRGNWLVNGFIHTLTPKEWYTDLFCSRLDYDAVAKEVGE